MGSGEPSCWSASPMTVREVSQAFSLIVVA